MPSRNTRLLALSLLVFSVFASAIAAYDDEKIDYVRTKALKKDVLSDADLRVIDDFVSATLEDFVHAEDYRKLAGLRLSISKRKGIREQSQYTAGFLLSARKHISWAFEQVDTMEEERFKTEAYRNLVILVAELESVDLVHLALPFLENENSTIRYWAVKALTGDAVLKKLNSAEPDKDFSDTVFAAIQSQTPHGNPETLGLIVQFASKLSHPRKSQILRDISDVRIKAYENWSVEQELMDATLLKALAGLIANPSFSSDRILFGRKFAQLYSYVIQRYMAAADSLPERSKLHLISVIADVENSTLFGLVGKRQSTIKKAVETGRFSSLQREHDLLLGSRTATGSLPTALGFNYGKQSGQTLTGPKKLPARPKPKPKPEETPEQPGS